MNPQAARLTFVLLCATAACKGGGDSTAVKPADLPPTPDSSTSAIAPPPVAPQAIAPETTADAGAVAERPPSANPAASALHGPATPTGTASVAPVATAPVAPAPPAPAPAPKPASAHYASTVYAVDASAPGDCHVGADCAMTLRLAASSPYHINKEYPYKFVATPNAAAQFLGEAGGATFSRASGAFQQQAEAVATMTVRFKGAAPGLAPIGGTFKLSVCSDNECKVETQAVELLVPIL